jgi:hypothetical protein
LTRIAARTTTWARPKKTGSKVSPNLIAANPAPASVAHS